MRDWARCQLCGRRTGCMAQRCCQVCATEQHEKKGNFFDHLRGFRPPPNTAPSGQAGTSTPYNYLFYL